MKKLILGLLSAAMVVGTAGISFAQQDLPQFCSFGYFRAAVSFVDNWGFDEDRTSDEQQIYQRVRQYFEYSANENLTAQVAYEIDNGWGFDGGDWGNDDTNQIEIKRAQLNFNWPNTEVNIQAGLSCWTAPGGAYGTPVLGGDFPGIFINAPINDMVSLTAGYVRAEDNTRIIASDDDVTSGDQVDAALLSLPVTMEGFSMSPYFIYSWIGDQSDMLENFQEWGIGVGSVAGQFAYSTTGNPYDEEVDAYWAGLPFSINMLDPLSIQGQALYGNVDGNDSALDREGYFFDINVDYAMDMFTPSVYFIYSSGDDDDLEDGSETFPSLFSDGFYYQPSGTATGWNTHFGHQDGNYGFAQYVPHAIWTAGFALKNIQFIDKLSHTFAIGYSQGTHDDEIFKDNPAVRDEFKDGRFQELTKEDEVMEVVLNSQYQIYENLKAVLELGYAELDMDEDVWGKDYRDDGLFHTTFGLSYDF